MTYERKRTGLEPSISAQITRSALGASLVLCAMACLDAPAVRAQSSDHASALSTRASDREEARALFAAGQAAVDAGRWTDALDAFHRAYELTHAPSALFNAAFALRALGRYEDAEAAFVELLALDGVRHPMRVEATGYLAEVRGRIAHIELDGLPDDAITTIHFDAEGIADDGTRPLVLTTDPGHHAIDVSLTGHERFEWAGDLADGQSLHLAVSLPLGTTGGRPAEVWEEGWFWVVIGVAVAGVVAGVVGGVIADQNAQLQPQGPLVVRL